MRVSLLVSVGFVLVTMSAGSAAADPFPNGGMRLADNNEHTYCFPGGAGAVPAGNQFRYDQAMANLDAQTVLFDTAMGCTANTDVAFREIDLAAAVRGQYQCLEVQGGRCQRSRADADLTEVFLQSAAFYPAGGAPLASSYEVNLVKTIRHEIGHSIGLNNDGVTANDANLLFVMGFGDVRGCSVSLIVPTELHWLLYSPHHVPEINAAY